MQAIGGPVIGDRYLDTLQKFIGADLCCAYSYEDGEFRPILIAASADVDISSIEASVTSQIIYALERPQIAADTGDFEVLAYPPRRLDRAVRASPPHVNEMLLSALVVRGESDGACYSLGAFKTAKSDPFTDANFIKVKEICSLLMSPLIRHAQLMRRFEPRSEGPLASTSRAVGLFSEMGLSDREAQVCARILAGITMEGVALDLDVAKTTALTYKRRAFEKLNISSYQQLFMLYHRASS